MTRIALTRLSERLRTVYSCPQCSACTERNDFVTNQEQFWNQENQEKTNVIFIKKLIDLLRLQINSSM